MSWTKKDRQKLLDFKKNYDSDDIRIKEKIKQLLLDNRYIIHVLNNKELEENDCEPDEYFGINILPYYLVTPTQTNVENFICFEISYNEASSFRYNKSHSSLNSTIKNLNIVFYILCEQKNIIDKETGIARHDLLAALLQDQFNWTNYFGSKIMLVSDEPSVVDNNYACRVLTFAQTTDNNIVKTGENGPRLANKDVVY